MLLDFASLDAAQRWLDEQPRGWWYYGRGQREAIVRNYAAHYGKSPARCVDDGIDAVMYYANFTQLKMAARRLSNALAYHHPQTFEPKRSRHAA